MDALSQTRPVSARRQRGAALTEFVVVAPLLVVCVYGAQYLMDLGTIKLKAQEIARYATWALAVQPLSDGERLRHQDAFNDARDVVTQELTDVYLDLDSAREELLPGRADMTMTAVYVPPADSELRNGLAGLLPSLANVSLVDSQTPVGQALQMLGMGTLSSFISLAFSNLKLNTKGQLTGRATVRVMPPARPEDQGRAVAIAKLGRMRGADLRRWMLTGVGRTIWDAPHRRMEITLIADPWRISQGWSAHPKNAENAPQSHYSNTVQGVAGALGFLSAFGPRIPREVERVVGGLNEPRVFSRPYTAGRTSRPSFTGAQQAAPGQVDIFTEVEQEPQEPGAVRKFETMPLYVDPDDESAGGYIELLNARGANFMGCPEHERRGCWE